MQINLEVTEVDQAATLTTSSTLPVTLKRTVDTTVIVKDQQTVVIGGLIDDSSRQNESKVPVLGDMPLLGWLFKKQSNNTDKTNLYVFLTPRVIKNPGEALGIFQQKKEQIDEIRGGEIKYYEKHSGEPEESIVIPTPIQEPQVVQPRAIEPGR
jgi:general secretion pathway protein D